jgi:DNA polymerase-3 subunit epsilon
MGTLEEKAVADVPVVVLDTETTGLSPVMGHRIVEIGAIRLEGWREVGRISQLVNPGRPIDPGASRVNGIFDKDVADAPPFSKIAPELQQLLDGALVVAHNAEFDAGFLGLEFALLDHEEASSAARNPWLCTLQLSRRFFYFGRNNLGHVARQLGVRTGRAHRALGDAYTTAEIFKRMTRQLGQRKLELVGDLLHAQGGAIYVPQPDHSHLPPVIARALVTRRFVHIRYKGHGYETKRAIQPLYAAQQNGKTYLIAYCQLRRSQRTFRLDRIVEAHPIDIHLSDGD